MGGATRTGGRDATTGVIPGRYALSVGDPLSSTPGGWQWTALADLARLESGHTPSRRKPEYWDGGDIPWIGIRDATGNHGGVLTDTQQHVTQLGIDNSSARLLPAGTVCLSRTASVGYVVAMARPMATSQDFVNWICGPGLLPDYLRYVLLAELDSYLAFASGTTHQTIYYPEVKAFHIKLPPIEEQRRIVHVLRSFDDLIENNRRRIEILEEMARLLYREWFVHFRFPGHEDVELVDSELGPIPEGWKASEFSGLVTESKKSVAPTEIPPGSALVGLEHLPRRSTTLTEWDVADNVGSRRKIFASGDILFGKIRPYFHKVVNAPVAGYSSTDAIVFRPSRYPERALCVASSDEFVAAAVATSNGTKMPRANTDLLLRYPIPEPPSSLAMEFEKRVESMSGLRGNLSQQNRVLRDARDLLLPRLVSGELDMSELDLDGVQP